MTRPSFITEIGGKWEHIENGTKFEGTIADAEYAREAVAGVSRRRPPGWVPPTPYSLLRERRSRCKGSYSRVTVDTYDGSTLSARSAVGVIDNPYTGLSPAADLFNESYVLPLTPPDSMVDRALVKARLAMKDSDVNLGVAFAERGATARMVGNNAIALAKAFKAIKQDRTWDAIKALGIAKRRGVSLRSESPIERWLELQYGWKPLLSDIYGACDALEKAPRSNWMITGKGSYREKIDIVKRYYDGTNFRYDTTVKGDVGVYVRIDAEPENELLHTLAALGITNPAEIAWELVPYSFVVDWMLPIGSWLSSLDAMLGYGPTWCSISRLSRATWKVQSIPEFARTSRTIVETTKQSWSARKEIVSLQRTVSQSVPLPSLPRFKDPRSLAHMANGLSLLAQAFSSLK